MFETVDTGARTPAAETALACLEAGIEAVRPEQVVPEHCRLEDDALVVGNRRYDLANRDRVLVVGGGKAASELALALESVLEPAVAGGLIDDLEGVVVGVRAVDTTHVAVRVGDHPTPSDRNVEATEAVIETARGASDRDLVVVVITGGASALLCAPATGLGLADLQATTEGLLMSGAAIDEINSVRRACSAIKGGGLAEAIDPARHLTLAISDVVGDDPTVIGSGPTVPNPTTKADAIAVLERRVGREAVPKAVWRVLEGGADGDAAGDGTASGDGDPADGGGGSRPVHAADQHRHWHCLASNATALEAARAVAVDRGYATLVLSSRLQGEAAAVGRVHAGIASEVLASGNPLEPKAVVLSGGEVTVTIDGQVGRGGPNQETSLAAAIDLASLGGQSAQTAFAAIDTDGIDGPTDACGGLVDASTLETPADRDRARQALAGHDAGTVLAASGGLVRTEAGYTGTNVNDLRVLVLED